MKKYFILFVTALAGLTVLSCQKEENRNDYKADANAIHFTVLAEGTKTVVDASENWVNWEATDALSIYETINYTESETAKTQVHTGTAAVSELSNGNKTASFEATLPAWTAPDGATVTGASYVAFNPSNALSQGGSGDNKFWRLQMPSTQTPVVGSFDPAADLLLSAPVNQAARVATGDKMSFRFHRLGTAVKMTLAGLPNGEKLKKVELTAPVNIVGYVKPDLSTGGYAAGTDIPYSGSKTITLTFSDWTIDTSVNSGNIDVWFRVLPGTWDGTLEIVAETDQARYYRNGDHSTAIDLSAAPMVFADGGRTTFSVSMASATRETVSSLADGNYVILAKKTATPDVYFALKAELSGTRVASQAYDGDLNSYSGGDDSIIWSVTQQAGGSYIIANDGKYVGSGTVKAASWEEPSSTWTEDEYLLDIAEHSTGLYYITSHANAEWHLSKNSSSDYFAFYANTSQLADIVFVPATVDPRTAVTLSFPESAVSFNTSNYDTFLGQNLTADPNVADITGHISWNAEDPDSILQEFDDGALILNGHAGTATISASFAGDTNYRPASASYTITVADSNVDYSTLETSNVTLSTAGGTNAYTATVNTNNALKAGKSGEAGAVQITVPAGTTNLHLHAAGWKGETVVVEITGATAVPSSLSLTSNDIFTGSSNDFTLSSGVADYYFNIALTGITAETTLTFTAASGKRFVIWGVNAVADTRADAEMSFSAASATATYGNNNSLSFTAPTFDPGYATGVTHQSTDETIATVNAAGEVTITALSGNVVKEGSTTIKAIFAGDATYKPQTVSYTLTVVDGRDAVATPTFDPAAGEVAANTVVNFQCATGGVTYHYTVDGSNPSVDSPVAASVTIDAAKTVKVLAAKEGYKPSAVASASYTIQGSSESVPYEESFSSSLGSFTLDNVVGSGAWTIDTSNHYVKGTSYIGGSNTDAESWLISPWIQLPAVNSGEYLQLKFQQCVNKFFGTVGDEATLWIQPNGGSWTQIVITYPTIASGNWSAFEEQVVDLASYAGQKVKIAFKYVGSSTTAGTWEIRNFSVKKYASYAVTFNTPSNGSITVKCGETTLSSGNLVLEGETVNITASPADGYSLSTLVYNDGTDHDITSTKYFTMPAHAVSITATFEVSTGTPTLQYTLDGTVTATGNAYATATNLTQGSIGWAVVGNTEQNPWRIGGKGLTNVDRALYSKTAISANISQINVTSGATASSLSVNSLTISVHNSAEDAASGANAIATKSVTTGIASSTVTFDKEDDTSWAGKYYRIVYNVTRTSTSGNGYVQFVSATFYGVE